MRAINFFHQKRLTTVAAAWVYYFLISLMPLTFLLIIVLSVFKVNLTIDLVSRLPEEFRLAGETIIETAEKASKGVTIFFVLTALFSCTSLLNQMSKDGDFIFEARSNKKRGLMRRVWAFLALCALFVLFLGLGYLLAFREVLDLKILIFSDKNKDILLKFFSFSIVIVVGYAIIYILNKFISPVKLNFFQTSLGSLCALFIMVFGTIGFTLYLRYFANYNAFYGSLAGIIIFLLWSYIIMFGLAFGTIINMHVYSWSKNKEQNLTNSIVADEREKYASNKKPKKGLSKRGIGC